MEYRLFSSTVGKRSVRVLEEKLTEFTRRFPVSGRIVRAVSQSVGGVKSLAERLEELGWWDRMVNANPNGKPGSLPPNSIRDIFDSSTVDTVALNLGIPAESVEIQAALGIPKFFITLANEEHEGLGLGFAKPRKSRFSPSPQARGSNPDAGR